MRATLLLPVLALPLAAQAWDLRLEVPRADGQNLPGTLLQGSVALYQKGLDTGQGYIATVSHRIIRVGPILKLEWCAEYSHLYTSGDVVNGTSTLASSLKQDGLGVGVNAQFWVPFTGLAGEMGLIERFHDYKYNVDNISQDEHIARAWLRVGLRYNFPLGDLSPYLAASYQQPLDKSKPVQVDSVSDVASYLSAQGSGQEFQRMWTFGVGVSF
jgi:hypothetical protein